jgi:hypothetical protein
VKYWVVIDNSDNRNWVEEEKTLEILGDELDSLNMAFTTLSSKGSALGNPRPWILKAGKQDWYMELRSPNFVVFCLADNIDWAYSTELKSTKFHELLREICCTHEKKSNPDIAIENIRICSRFSGIKSPQEHIVPVNAPIPLDSKEDQPSP